MTRLDRNLYEISHVHIFQLFRHFHDQKILQQTFGEWKEWWSASRGRKLSLRAASQDRFVKALPDPVLVQQQQQKLCKVLGELIPVSRVYQQYL